MATMMAEDRPRYDELLAKGMSSSAVIKQIEAEKDKKDIRVKVKEKSDKTALRGKEIKEGEAKAKAEEEAKIKKETERSEKESERETEKKRSAKEKETEKERKEREREKSRRDREREIEREKSRSPDKRERDTDRYSKDYSKDKDDYKGGKGKMARKGEGMVSHIVSDIQEEGGNFAGEGLGLIGGLYLAQYVGNYIEKSVTPQASTFGDFISWTLNNFPKVVAYYLADRYVGYYEERGLIGGAMFGAKISLPTSIMLDTYYRLAHKKLLNMTQSNETVIKEKLSQENNVLRIRLQTVLNRLSERLSESHVVSQQPTVIFVNNSNTIGYLPTKVGTSHMLLDNSKVMSDNNPVIEQQQPIIGQAEHSTIQQNADNVLNNAYRDNSALSIGYMFGML